MHLDEEVCEGCLPPNIDTIGAACLLGLCFEVPVRGSSTSRGRGRRRIRLARRSVAGCGNRPVLADTQRTLAILEHIAGVESALHLDSCRTPAPRGVGQRRWTPFHELFSSSPSHGPRLMLVFDRRKGPPGSPAESTPVHVEGTRRGYTEMYITPTNEWIKWSRGVVEGDQIGAGGSSTGMQPDCDQA